MMTMFNTAHDSDWGGDREPGDWRKINYTHNHFAAYCSGSKRTHEPMPSVSRAARGRYFLGPCGTHPRGVALRAMGRGTARPSGLAGRRNL